VEGNCEHWEESEGTGSTGRALGRPWWTQGRARGRPWFGSLSFGKHKEHWIHWVKRGAALLFPPMLGPASTPICFPFCCTAGGLWQCRSERGRRRVPGTVLLTALRCTALHCTLLHCTVPVCDFCAFPANHSPQSFPPRSCCRLCVPMCPHVYLFDSSPLFFSFFLSFFSLCAPR